MNTFDHGPLNRVYRSGAVAEMRRHERGYWRKHGWDTALFLLLTGGAVTLFFYWKWA